MTAKWISFIFLGVIIMNSYLILAQKQKQIEYQGRTPEGLVGNGSSIVIVRPTGFRFHYGGDAIGRFNLIIDNKKYEIESSKSNAYFFPGGVIYKLVIDGLNIEVLHGAMSEVPYIVVVRVKGAKKNVMMDVNSHGNPIINPNGRIRVNMKKGVGQVTLAAGTSIPGGTLEDIRKQIEMPYLKGFLLETPSPAVDRAVPFCRNLLDLGFNGKLHVCEIFRWRDVWSRDLGSGLAPGAMISGRFSAAKTTIEYDLQRYATKNPRGLKVTEDPSQGGSAEGTAWLTRAVWRYYLLTNDKEFLIQAARILLPWVNAWIDRDADENGLLVDVTEWMDHSRFFLFPDGARVLYSNVLFVDLLNTFSKIEQTLGDMELSQRFDNVKKRFISGINAGLWNESTGEYDNLSLWGRRDERSSSAENALAVLCGVASPDRIKRVLNAVREKNWRPAGSVTITPPMTHVDITCDHNYKMWPWWNAVEARTRLRNGDIEGGIHLLEKCSATLEDEHYPGMMEELTSPEGITEGGNAFLSAAGSYLDAIFEGLLGIEILEPGCNRIRVSPNVPDSWKDWQANIPLPEGDIIVIQKNGKLQIRVTDPRVKIIEAPESATVEGAEYVLVNKPDSQFPNDLSLPTPLQVPPPRTRKAALFFEKGIPSGNIVDLPKRKLSITDLANLDTVNIEAIIIAGNSLPRKTQNGIDLQSVLARFLDRGGAIVFYGATMQDRGTMGEHSGVIDWYEYRPGIHYESICNWKFQPSWDSTNIPRENERGLLNGWYKSDVPDSGWKNIKVPQLWEDHLGLPYDGWGWYRVHFQLPTEARGKTIILDLGQIDDEDWTYVNGILVGSMKGWQVFRRYSLKPDDPVYSTLNFGGDNVLAVQVFDGGGGGGLYADSTRLGFETGKFAWLPINPMNGMTCEHPVRHGVVSWGPGGDFFNSWETSRGAFGFKVDGKGVEFSGPLSELSPLDVNITEAFTDFAISKPWLFQPLAFTETHRKLLYPDHGERYPCIARVVNTKTGGEFILIPASITQTAVAHEVLKKLGIILND
jgi:hypothetical protein